MRSIAVRRRIGNVVVDDHVDRRLRDRGQLRHVVSLAELEYPVVSYMPSTKCGLPSMKCARLAGSIHAFMPARADASSLTIAYGLCVSSTLPLPSVTFPAELVGAERQRAHIECAR